MKKGDKIKCVNGDFDHVHSDKTIPREYLTIKLPKEGKIYTVRSVVETEVGDAIRLVEIKNKKIHHDMGGLQEPAFSMFRFKKVK